MWFGKNTVMKNIEKQLKSQQDVIDTYIYQLSDRDRNRLEWCTIHQRECQSTGLLMWEKDLDFRYTFMNTRYCNDFLSISLAKVKSLIGKTDLELIKDFTKRTGLSHTFGNMCKITDMFMLAKNKSCRFWEMGYIDDRIFIFDITKKPLIKNTQVVGIQAWALNNSKKECEIKALLELFLKTGEAVKLATTPSESAAYYIRKENNPFGGDFPA